MYNGLYNRRTKIHKKRDSDGVERTIPCPHKVIYIYYYLKTASVSIIAKKLMVYMKLH